MPDFRHPDLDRLIMARANAKIARVLKYAEAVAEETPALQEAPEEIRIPAALASLAAIQADITADGKGK